VALDIKGPLDRRYGDSVGISKFAAASILQSMVKVARSGVDYELRTTVVPELHSEADLLDLARQLSEVAPKATWFLQNFQPKNCLNPEFEKIKPYDNIFFERLIGKLRVHMPQVELRG
jgi:pyruvate formate lyase activating enzyme